MTNAERLRKLFRYLRSGDLRPEYRYFLMKIVWPLFHREFLLKNAVKVMEEDWTISLWWMPAYMTHLRKW